MKNPYQTPNSDLVNDGESEHYKPAFFWQLYFWVNLIGSLFIFGFYTIFSSGVIDLGEGVFFGSDFNFLDWFDFITWLPMLIAIYGMAWTKKYFNRLFWYVYISFCIIWSIIYAAIFPFYLGVETFGEVGTIYGLIYDVPITLIDLYVLYRYMFTMKYLWLKESKIGECT